MALFAVFATSHQPLFLACSPLSLSWLDVVRIPEMGRWWLIGAAWVGNRTGDLAQGNSAVEDAKKKAKERILAADDRR